MVVAVFVVALHTEQVYLIVPFLEVVAFVVASLTVTWKTTILF